MKNFMRRANSALLCIVVFLGLALTGLTLSNVQAQTGGTLDPRGWDPQTPEQSGCERYIDMTSTCPTGLITDWGATTTICKTSGIYPNIWCCDYTKWPKLCRYTPGGAGSSAGYKAAFASEFYDLTCGGAFGSQCQ